MKSFNLFLWWKHKIFPCFLIHRKLLQWVGLFDVGSLIYFLHLNELMWRSTNEWLFSFCESARMNLIWIVGWIDFFDGNSLEFMNNIFYPRFMLCIFLHSILTLGENSENLTNLILLLNFNIVRLFCKFFQNLVPSLSKIHSFSK